MNKCSKISGLECLVISRTLHWPYVHDQLWPDIWTNGEGWSVFEFKDAGKGVYSCPDLARVQAHWSHHVNSYTYNAGTADGKAPFGLGGLMLAGPGVPWGTWQVVRDGEVVAPSSMIGIGDTDVLVATPIPAFANAGFLDDLGLAASLQSGVIAASSYGGMAGVWASAVQRRHRGRWEVVFCEGHVEGLTAAEMFDVRQPEVRKRWNRDNLAH